MERRKSRISVFEVLGFYGLCGVIVLLDKYLFFLFPLLYVYPLAFSLTSSLILHDGFYDYDSFESSRRVLGHEFSFLLILKKFAYYYEPFLFVFLFRAVITFLRIFLLTAYFFVFSLLHFWAGWICVMRWGEGGVPASFLYNEDWK